MFNPHHVVETGLTVTRTKPYHPPYRFGIAWSLIFFCVSTGFAQKILGGHRPPLQLGVRNCRGAL